MEARRSGNRAGRAAPPATIGTKQNSTAPSSFHVELPRHYEPKGSGQAAAKRRPLVYLQGRYEVQVLDSYGIPADNSRPGHLRRTIYGVRPSPPVNECKAPTGPVWQTSTSTSSSLGVRCKRGGSQASSASSQRIQLIHDRLRIARKDKSGRKKSSR